MSNNLSIYSQFAHRSDLQAQMRAMVSQAHRWAQMAQNGEYAAGYYAGYLDAIDQLAGSIEVDAGITRTQTQLIING